MLPLGPPDRYGSPYKAARRSPRGRACSPSRPRRSAKDEELDFREREASWIEDWARFAGRGAIADQVRFEREWSALRAYANERGVRLIGDVPIYVAPGSADHRARPELFRDDAVAGTPPDAYTDKGQLWGNPLYDWPALHAGAATAGGSRGWRARSRSTTSRGSTTSAASSRTGRCRRARATRSSGRWRRGPGRAVFDAAGEALGALPLIAEDLGVITPPVRRLRDALGLPGMVVLQFGWVRGAPDNVHDVANHAEHRIAYTGTHDNDTLRGWYESLPAATAGAGRRDAAGRRGGALVGSHRAHVLLARAGRDGAGAGRARARERGAHEPAWDGEGRVEVAAGCVASAALGARLREAAQAAGRAPA